MSVAEIPDRLSRRAALPRIGAAGLASILAAGGLGRPVRGVRAAPLPDIVIEWFGAWTSDDPSSQLAALYGADGTYEDVPSGAYVLAPDIAGYLPSAPVRPATVNRYMRGSFAVDGLAVVEQLFFATNQPFAPGLPAGVPFEVFAVTIFEYDSGSLRRSADYYDYDSILRQVGIPSTSPSPGNVCASADRSGSRNLSWA